MKNLLNFGRVDKYNSQILYYLEPFFNYLLPIGAVITLISVLSILYGGDINLSYIMLDCLLIIILMLLFFLKNKVNIQTKMGIIMFILLFYGNYLLYNGGIYKSGIYLIGVSVLLTLVFMDRKMTLFAMFLTTITYVLIYIKIANGGYVKYQGLMTIEHTKLVYVLHYIGSILVCIVAYTTVYYIKSFLIVQIEKLELQMIELNDSYASLDIKNKQISQLAYYNRLTKLPNRDLFTVKVNEMLNKHGNGTLILADIAQFHQINSFYGMKKGDEILVSIGNYFKESLLDTRICGHLGGNLFAVWIRSTPGKEYLQKQFDTVRKEVKNFLNISINVEGYCVAITNKSEYSNFNDIYKMADLSLNYLKRNDIKNTVVFKADSYDVLHEFEMYSIIVEQAIINKKFSIHYQEKYDCINNKVIGLEALARLSHNEANISPGKFIPIIDDNNLSTEFGKVIIEKVFMDFPKIMKKYGEDISVSINVSPQQLALPTFVNELSELMERYNINPKTIELEITENVLIANFEQIIKLISSIKNLGVKISVDDFGTGYSSLKYIAELPIDVIKIDKTFIDKIVYDQKTVAVVTAIIQLAKDIEYMVVAEGVEEPEQLKVLNDLGCNIIQGFLMSKPKPIE